MRENIENQCQSFCVTIFTIERLKKTGYYLTLKLIRIYKKTYKNTYKFD